MVEVVVARWGLSRGGGMVVVVVDGGAVVVGDGSCEVARWRDVCGWMGAMLGCVDPRPRQQYAPHPSPTSHRTRGDGGEHSVATGMYIEITRPIHTRWRPRQWQRQMEPRVLHYRFYMFYRFSVKSKT